MVRVTWLLEGQGGEARRPGEGERGVGKTQKISDLNDGRKILRTSSCTWSFMRATRGDMMRVILLRPDAIRQATSEGNW